MTEQPLTGKKIAFLLTNGVEQIELTSPREALANAGADTVIISPERESITAMQHDWDHGDTFSVDVPVAQADSDDFDALVLPGGTLNADSLRLDKDAAKLVKSFHESGKLVAAICHAPWILINTRIAKGKRLTSYESLSADLKNAGAEWVDEPLVEDGNLITSRNPGDLEHFNKAIISALS